MKNKGKDSIGDGPEGKDSTVVVCYLVVFVDSRLDISIDYVDCNDYV